MIRRLLICLFLLSNKHTAVLGQQPARIQWSINDNWKYLPQGADFAQRPKADDSKWQSVNIPHTWNAKDPFDDDETSRRDISWYRKKLLLDKRFKDKKIYLNFEGAYQVADVYVNGVFAGQHKGGYTGFTFDITHLVKLGDTSTENLVAVQLNNAQDNFIPPLSIGYASYGGIYRDAWLIGTDKLHFKMLDHGASGLYIATPKVDSTHASVQIRTVINNDDHTERKFELLHIIYDAGKKEVARTHQSYTLAPDKEIVLESGPVDIKKPELWSPERPYLYTVKSQLIEKGQVVDELSNPLGFRWFKFDPDKGFSLNGKKLILKGTNRHQDMKDHGDALSAADHYRDLKLIKDMGCNFLRLAHYPQAPEVLKLADKLGLLVWEEIPLVNYMNPVPEFLKNSETMIREMIRQNYNHPSVIIWGSMNEVLLWSEKAERIQVQENVAYINKVKAYAKKLDSTVRAEDPYRYSTMAMHMSDDYDKYGLSDIPQLASYNIYNGWYSGRSEEFKPAIDEKHLQNPKQVLFISEYGAEADNRVNTENPQRFDFTGQYQRLYHESYLEQMKKMPYLAGTAIWNQFDFSQPNVGGVSNNMNQKGMVTWDRKPKDSYYLYKANWNVEPMIYIASRDWTHRAGLAGAQSTIEVYTNLNEVNLIVNGVSYGKKNPDQVKKIVWKVKLKDGINEIVANGKSSLGQVNDHLALNYKVYTATLKSAAIPFTELAINVGSNAQYLDNSDRIWLEDRPYKTGSFGYIGGAEAMLNIKTVKKNTNDNPLFYSYRDGLKGYRFDVPDGLYELELGFIESDKLLPGERVFDVTVNNNTLLKDLDLTAGWGFGVALKKKFMIKAENGKGVQVDLRAGKGKTTLSGIKLKAVN